ncbi:MAG: HlyD family efflux transporter periplasmic adaptor subunit [Tannerellaceae bacterium]|jgi:HlyD family secretion protein|nr:HlyD family efflux transporter periplasmic adaptor subunit [Tannerellaceae bacterium]
MNKNFFLILLLPALFSCSSGATRTDASGAFEATEVTISSEANGRIIELSVREGDRLQAGDYLGYVDSAQLYLSKKQLASGLKAIDAQKPDIRKQIAVLEQQIATARTERQRMQNLVDAKAGTQKQLDDITHQIDFLNRQLEAQRSTLGKTTGGMDAEAESLLYRIMQLDDMLGKCRILSPVTGDVLTVYAHAGEVTAAGRPLFKVADTRLLYLRAYVTADQLSMLSLGQSLQVFADYGKGERREYEGTLTWISPKAEFTPKGIQNRDERANLVYAIKIAVRNDGMLKIGQYGEIAIPR